jgi:hypothetical protein
MDGTPSAVKLSGQEICASAPTNSMPAAARPPSAIALQHLRPLCGWLFRDHLLAAGFLAVAFFEAAFLGTAFLLFLYCGTHCYWAPGCFEQATSVSGRFVAAGGRLLHQGFIQVVAGAPSRVMSACIAIAANIAGNRAGLICGGLRPTQQQIIGWFLAFLGIGTELLIFVSGC